MTYLSPYQSVSGPRPKATSRIPLPKTPRTHGATVKVSLMTSTVFPFLRHLEHHSDIHVIEHGPSTIMGLSHVILRSEVFPRTWEDEVILAVFDNESAGIRAWHAPDGTRVAMATQEPKRPPGTSRLLN